MSRRRRADADARKALSLWESPDGAGEPRVCVATTFTFDATFFETECLGRFLQMDSHPSESESVEYLVEREEKLAAAHVSVLVDRRHARDKESFRWDVLGVIVPRAIQHSKVAVLMWTSHVRVIVGSGNLTEPGYRKNLEVFGTFDLNQESGDRGAVDAALEFLEEVEALAVGINTDGSPRGRTRAALRAIQGHIRSWKGSSSADSRAIPIFGSPKRSVVGQFASLWPASGPAREAYVLSPFFDRDERATNAIKAFLPLLAKRRPRAIYFDVRAETRPDGRRRVFAPLGMVEHAAKEADVQVRPVLMEQAGELRELHAKMTHLASDDWLMAMIGSSNFTAAGIGSDEGHGNLEANIVYRLRRSDREAKVLGDIWPQTGDDIDVASDQLIWDPQGEEEEGGGVDVPLPAAFEEAIFTPGQNASLTVVLKHPLPRRWEIRMPDGRGLLTSNGSQAGTHVIQWTSRDVPFVLDVSWLSSSGMAVANWPVNVSNPAALPPPEALRDLTLEELLEILASTRPLPQAVAQALRSRVNSKKTGDSEIDPLKRFDSHAFLLRRTKRVAAALDRLRERLERPVFSLDAFEWRLTGPIGPISLADAFVRESRLPGEGKFCLAELALALRRVRPEMAASAGLSGAAIRTRLRRAIEDVESRSTGLPSSPELDAYVVAAFQEART